MMISVLFELLGSYLVDQSDPGNLQILQLQNWTTRKDAPV